MATLRLRKTKNDSSVKPSARFARPKVEKSAFKRLFESTGDSSTLTLKSAMKYQASEKVLNSLFDETPISDDLELSSFRIILKSIVFDSLSELYKSKLELYENDEPFPPITGIEIVRNASQKQVIELSSSVLTFLPSLLQLHKTEFNESQFGFNLLIDSIVVYLSSHKTPTFEDLMTEFSRLVGLYSQEIKVEQRKSFFPKKKQMNNVSVIEYFRYILFFYSHDPKFTENLSYIMSVFSGVSSENYLDALSAAILSATPQYLLAETNERITNINKNDVYLRGNFFSSQRYNEWKAKELAHCEKIKKIYSRFLITNIFSFVYVRVNSLSFPHFDVFSVYFVIKFDQQKFRSSASLKVESLFFWADEFCLMIPKVYSDIHVKLTFFNQSNDKQLGKVIIPLKSLLAETKRISHSFDVSVSKKEIPAEKKTNPTCHIVTFNQPFAEIDANNQILQHTFVKAFVSKGARIHNDEEHFKLFRKIVTQISSRHRIPETFSYISYLHSIIPFVCKTADLSQLSHVAKILMILRKCAKKKSLFTRSEMKNLERDLEILDCVVKEWLSSYSILCEVDGQYRVDWLDSLLKTFHLICDFKKISSKQQGEIIVSLINNGIKRMLSVHFFEDLTVNNSSISYEEQLTNFFSIISLFHKQIDTDSNKYQKSFAKYIDICDYKVGLFIDFFKSKFAAFLSFLPPAEELQSDISYLHIDNTIETDIIKLKSVKKDIILNISFKSKEEIKSLNEQTEEQKKLGEKSSRIIMNIIEIYMKVNQLLFLFSSVSKKTINLDIYRPLVQYILVFLWSTSLKQKKWLRNSINSDKWVLISNEERFSTSAADLSSVCTPIIDFLKELKWGLFDKDNIEENKHSIGKFLKNAVSITANTYASYSRYLLSHFRRLLNEDLFEPPWKITDSESQVMNTVETLSVLMNNQTAIAISFEGVSTELEEFASKNTDSYEDCYIVVDQVFSDSKENLAECLSLLMRNISKHISEFIDKMFNSKRVSVLFKKKVSSENSLFDYYDYVVTLFEEKLLDKHYNSLVKQLYFSTIDAIADLVISVAKTQGTPQLIIKPKISVSLANDVLTFLQEFRNFFPEIEGRSAHGNSWESLESLLKAKLSSKKQKL